MKRSSFLDGQMLIAMPGMSDPRFDRSVIFMCAHSDNGAMGIIVNKRAPMISFSELLERLDIMPQENRIKLPDETAQRLRGHVGREVTLGVRQEDLAVAGAAESDHPCFDAVIEVVEQLGSEILLDMKVGGHVMVAAVEPTVRVKVRDKLRIAMRPSSLHVFDAKTEAAI